jgi:hypothetical protein
VVQLDAHAPFDKGRLLVRRLVHKSSCAGLLGGARSRSLGTEGAEALPRWDPPDKLPSLALEHDMWGALEPVGSRKGLNAHTVVWTSLGPLPQWVSGLTTRWAPGTTRLALHGT